MSNSITKPPSNWLPENLPGIDIKSGLQMCNKNSALYVEMLQKLQETKRNTLDEISTLLAAGDRDTSARNAHSMKSIAAILGAADLSAAARLLEEAIVKSMDDQLEIRLHKYGQALNLVISSLDDAFGPVVAEPEPLCVPSESHAEITVPHGSKTILLAEDDHMQMEVTSHCLEASGYKVLKARDGVEAVELFEKFQEQIDLVILDAIMPNMAGKQAWDEIFAIRPNVKACFISGYTKEIMGGKVALDYSLPFISKPVVPATLLRKVREILDA